MDALSALSVASTIITFVDFGGKLLSNTRELYKSKDGALSSIVDTEVVTSDLLALLEGLKQNIPEKQPSTKQHHSLDSDEDDEALNKICVRCVALAEELAVRLNKLKLPTVPPDETKKTGTDSPAESAYNTPYSSTLLSRTIIGGEGSKKAIERAKAPTFRKWQSFRKALEAVWGKREIEEMAATLRDLRDEMEFRILVSFRRSLQTVAGQQSDAAIQLEQSTHRIIDTFLNSRESFADQIKVQTETLIQIQDLLTTKQVDNTRRPEGVSGGQLDVTGFSESSLVDEGPTPRGLERRSEREMAEEEKLCRLMADNEILGDLSFPSMITRDDSIETAHPQTFRWVYEEPGPSRMPWHNLVAWLRHGHGIYWVNGKLGSGKSTLMKYVYEHNKTRDELGSWAQGQPLEVYGFFFWDRGDEDQRSQSGLLRSLLFQLFQRHRDKLEQLLPDTWNTHFTRANALLSRRDMPPNSPTLPPKPPDLTLSQLKEAFRNIVVNLEKQVNICFFIDGLDEYDGDYFELAEFFLQHVAQSGVKFCLSSRPLPVFEQAFRDLPGLRVQDLTKRDIKEYVNSHLYGHKHMKQLAKRHPEETSQLVSDVVRKAKGVFLWVRCVTRSLLRGLSDYNRISELKRRVSYLPSDLEALYKHILDGADPFYRTQMSRIFQIVHAAQNGWPGLVTLLDLSWADDEDDLLVETAPIQPCNEDEIEERCEIMGARLKSICGGLLETKSNRLTSLRPDSCVVYMHHTVSDWLAGPDVWKDIISITAGTGFSPNLALLKSRVMKLKTWNPTYHGRLDLNMVVDALNYAREAERDLQCGFPTLLDQLDVTTEYHWRHTRDVASYLQKRPSYMSSSSLSSSSSSDSCDSWYSFPDVESEAGDSMSPSNSQTVQSTRTPIQVPARNSLYQDRRREGLEESMNRPHWSHAIELPGGRTMEGQSTFFDLARAFGLKHYIDMKYDAGHVAVEHEVNHWLLMQAFSGTCASASSNKPKDPDPEQIRRILASGIDPNMSFDGGLTPWQGAILDAFWHLSRRPSPSNDKQHALWGETAQAWVEILEEFLQHGSDPHCPAVKHRHLPGFPRVTPMGLVEAYSVNSLTEKAARLEACINTEATRRTRPRNELRANTAEPDATRRSVGQRTTANSRTDSIRSRGILQWLFA